ncbi:MAG: DUF542 domain-containing protein [Candidatus Dadabacteria bacterium]
MYSSLTVSDIVNRDYGTADVFTKWGINYCCGGNITLTKVCEQQNIDQAAVEAELKEATKKINVRGNPAYNEWPIDFLVDYVIYVHHAYVRKVGPQLNEQLKQVAEAHKAKHPELELVQDFFQDLIDELLEHMQSEEDRIFPYIKQINNTYNRKEVYGKLFVRTLRKPLTDVVEKEHSRITATLIQLRKITNDFTISPDTCPKVQVIYRKLQEFDRDLVQHKHLENNILVPRAVAMEKELLHL